MLCLMRRQGQKIFIGNEIEIVVLQVQDGKVRIGIQAPASVTILREEVRDRLLAQQDDERAEQ